MDPGTQLIESAAGGLMGRVLGPTADYVGVGLQLWTEKRVNNVKRIFQKAEKRLGPDIDRPGSVPPRVLKGILDDGSFIEDELGAEYLGGVLASSRSETDRDDRGTTLVALVGRLSTYQLRLHYIFYVLCQRGVAGKNDLNLGQQDIRKTQARCFLSFEDGHPR